MSSKQDLQRRRRVTCSTVASIAQTTGSSFRGPLRGRSRAYMTYSDSFRLLRVGRSLAGTPETVKEHEH